MTSLEKVNLYQSKCWCLLLYFCDILFSKLELLKKGMRYFERLDDQSTFIPCNLATCPFKMAMFFVLACFQPHPTVTKWDERNLSNTNFMWLSRHFFTQAFGNFSNVSCSTNKILPLLHTFSAELLLHNFFYILCIICPLLNLTSAMTGFISYITSSIFLSQNNHWPSLLRSDWNHWYSNQDGKGRGVSKQHNWCAWQSP